MLTCRTCGTNLTSIGKNKKARYCDSKCANTYYHTVTHVYTPVSLEERKQQLPRPDLSKEERDRKNLIWGRYKLSWEKYLELHSVNSGGCAICKSPLSLVKNKESKFPTAIVDHCHTTGKVRGLLCSSCNKGLGHFKDSANFLEKASQYIKETK